MRLIAALLVLTDAVMLLIEALMLLIEALLLPIEALMLLTEVLMTWISSILDATSAWSLPIVSVQALGQEPDGGVGVGGVGGVGVGSLHSEATQASHSDCGWRYPLQQGLHTVQVLLAEQTLLVHSALTHAAHEAALDRYGLQQSVQTVQPFDGRHTGSSVGPGVRLMNRPLPWVRTGSRLAVRTCTCMFAGSDESRVVLARDSTALRHFFAQGRGSRATIFSSRRRILESDAACISASFASNFASNFSIPSFIFSS